MAKMWEGRFSKALDQQADDFNSSIHFDHRMFRQDIKGSMAHAAMLAAKGIIGSTDADAIISFKVCADRFKVCETPPIRRTGELTMGGKRKLSVTAVPHHAFPSAEDIEQLQFVGQLIVHIFHLLSEGGCISAPESCDPFTVRPRHRKLT